MDTLPLPLQTIRLEGIYPVYPYCMGVSGMRPDLGAIVFPLTNKVYCTDFSCQLMGSHLFYHNLN